MEELFQFLVEGNCVGAKFSLISFFSRFIHADLSFWSLGMGSGLDRFTLRHLLNELVEEGVLVEINTGAINTYAVSVKCQPLLEGLHKLHPIEKQKLEQKVRENMWRGDAYEQRGIV